jgi:hypothetical protein
MAVIEGGEKDPSVERRGVLKKRGDLPEQSFENVGDYPQVLEPPALRSLLQRPRIESFFPRMEGLHKQSRIMHHMVPLPAIRLLVVVKEGTHLPGGEGCLGEVLREGFSVLGYCARNGDDHPRGGPRRDRSLSDQLHEVFGEGAVKRQPAGDPPLGASHERGDPALRKVVVIMEFPYEGRLLDSIPLPPMGPGEDLHEGLFLCAVPDLPLTVSRPQCFKALILRYPSSNTKAFVAITGTSWPIRSMDAARARLSLGRSIRVSA